MGRTPLLVLAIGALATARLMGQGDGSPAAFPYDPAVFEALEYRMVGPTQGGRVTAVAGHRKQPGTFYMGATGGGVWKTTDYGTTWANVSDGFFATPSIGAIAVAESDPDIVWVGTGSDGIRSNVITGRGVYRSLDGGATWRFVGLQDGGQIGAVLVHPTNPDVAYVAALGHPFGRNPERGVYRTTDGGNSWTRMLFLSDSTGAIDLEFAPDDPRQIYASMWRGERKPWTIISGAREGGVYRSNDAGETWTKLGGGLPAGLVGKSDLAVSPADPSRLYVLIEAAPGGGLYRSDDRGDSFRLVSDQRGLLDRPFYYTNVDADPTNADVVYVNSTSFYKSVDGGETFARLRTPHGDNHDMWLNPDDPRIFIQANDGGANVTTNAGATWSSQMNQPTAELYQVSVDDQYPYWLYAGQQDDGTVAVPSLPPHPTVAGATGWWIAVGGCETGPAVPKPGNHHIVYANCKGRFGRFDKRTGQEQQYYVGAQNLYGHNPKDLKYRFQRVSPIEVSPHDPDVVYHASQYVHVTRDGGVTWETISPDLTAFEPDKQVASGEPITRDITGEEFYSTIYALRESPLEPGVIWVGSNDGLVHVSQNGGTTWVDVTPPDLPPHGRVQHLEPSPHRPGKAYVTVYRYLVDDWSPYLYRTADYGKSWTLLTTGANGIPADRPTRVVREDPDREGLLYAGTEFGMYVSFDDGARWLPFQQNLPVVPITDIKVYRQDLVLSTMGRSFWILDDVSPLHELSATVARAPRHLFQPRDAVRYRHRGETGDASQPSFPAPGAVIAYYLASEATDEVVLEIIDGEGQVLRRFSSAEDGAADEVTQGMRAPVVVRAGRVRLPTERGLHRIRWDLAHPGPWSADARSAGTDGPLALPGAYRARLSVGSWQAERTFRIAADPRVRAAGVTEADLEAQLALSLRARDALSAARLASRRIASLLAERSEGVDTARLKTLERQLDTDDAQPYPRPMLIDQLEYLYEMLTQADQPPGRDAYERFRELQAGLESILGGLDRTGTSR